MADAGASPRNPALQAASVVRMLAAAGARVIGVPCNTFHAPAIFDRFRQEIRDLTDGEDGLQVVHMIRATLDHVASAYPGARRVGILSTNGTYLHRIYWNAIAERGLEPLVLPYEPRAFSPAEQAERRDAIIAGRLAPLQNDVHHAIASVEWGIKSGLQAGEGYPGPKAVLKAAARRLVEAGADVLILGCTEIPLALSEADVPDLALADPLEALARGLVEAWRARFSPSWPAATALPFLPG